MSIGDSPSDEEDCEEMGDDDDGSSIADVATAGLEIGGCLERENNVGHKIFHLVSLVTLS